MTYVCWYEKSLESRFRVFQSD